MNTIKAGDTFSVSIRIYDEIEKAPVVLDETVNIYAKVSDLYSKVLTELNVTLYNQIDTAGWILLSASAESTSKWPKGRGVLDIKISVDTTDILSTSSYEFLIEGTR